MNITLTKEESEVLVTILSMVGGNPNRSARKVADDIIEKMGNLGVFSSVSLDNKYPVESDRCVIWFVEE